MAVKNDQGLARTAGTTGAPGLDPAAFTFAFTPGACAKDVTANVTVTYTGTALTGMFGKTLTLTGVGAMRCGG
jgi:hypothetical protein